MFTSRQQVAPVLLDKFPLGSLLDIWVIGGNWHSGALFSFETKGLLTNEKQADFLHGSGSRVSIL